MNLQSLKSSLRNFLVRCVAPFSEITYRERPRSRVICLHDISPSNQHNFAKKIGWLSENYRIVSLGDIYYRSNLDPHTLNVALTFDDGFKEHYSIVAPLLRKFNLPATFFIPSGSLDLTMDDACHFSKQGLRRQGTFSYMTKQEVAELAGDHLFEIGGHTTNHINLGEIVGRANLDTEIVHDKLTLQDVTGKELRWFAFPFGGTKNISVVALQLIQNAGYLASFTITPSFWPRDQNPYLIGRDSLLLESDEEVWRNSLRGGYDLVSRIKNFMTL